MIIQSYSFGKMEIDGSTFTSDLIIYPDRIEASWWRQSGHRLVLADIRPVLEEKPDVLIIGTGFMGLMKVSEEVFRFAKERPIELVVEKTKKAADAYNRHFIDKKTIGAFHLTC